MNNKNIQRDTINYFWPLRYSRRKFFPPWESDIGKDSEECWSILMEIREEKKNNKKSRPQPMLPNQANYSVILSCCTREAYYDLNIINITQ